MAEEYTPGVVNIGKQEVRYRRLSQGWGGLSLSIALFVIIYFFNFSLIVYLLLFIPIFISFMGFYQAKEQFCIAYGKTGVCNIEGDFGETRDIVGRLNRKKDSSKANQMLIISAIFSATLTLIIALVSIR